MKRKQKNNTNQKQSEQTNKNTNKNIHKTKTNHSGTICFFFVSFLLLFCFFIFSFVFLGNMQIWDSGVSTGKKRIPSTLAQFVCVFCFFLDCVFSFFFCGLVFVCVFFLPFCLIICWFPVK